MLEYYLLPKLISFAETAWGEDRNWETMENRKLREEEMDKGWNIFANTLAQKELPRMSRLFGGFNYRVPAPGAKIEDGKLYANSTFPGLSVRYTVDGSEPMRSSTLYETPVAVKMCIRDRKILIASTMAANPEVTITYELVQIFLLIGKT